MMNKKVIKISAAALVLGLLTSLIPIFSFTPHQWGIKIIEIIRQLSPEPGLSFFSNSLFNHTNHESNLNINFIDLTIYILMLFGLMLYLKSKGKEIRLLRFTFAIILVTQAVSIVNYLLLPYIPVVYDGSFQVERYFSNFRFLWVFVHVFWFLASYHVLKKLSQPLQVKHDEDVLSKDFIDTPKVQRFLHHILDLVLSVAIFSEFVKIIFSFLLRPVLHAFGETVSMYVIVIISRLLYLVLFEKFFEATPAKVLTGSRLVADGQGTISTKTLFLRNLTRHIPFEAFSYLEKGNGWHDSWFNTRVVKESNNGVPAKKYLWIFPILVFIGISSFLGYVWKQEYERDQWERNIHNNKIEQIENALSQLSTDHFFKIKNSDNLVDDYYLKVDAISPEAVVFKYFEPTSKLGSSSYKIGNYYEQHKDTLPSLRISKSTLINSYTKKYNQEKKGAQLIPNSSEKYYISNVFKGYQTNLSVSGINTAGNNSISIGLSNDGWPGKLKSINNLEGNINWLNELPEEIDTNDGYVKKGIHLQGENIERQEPYKSSLLVLDTLGREEKYILKGLGSNVKITKVGSASDP